MPSTKHSRPTVGVLAGAQVYYGTILGNFIGPVLQGVHSTAQTRGCNLLLACGMEHSTISARPAWPVLTPEVNFVPVGPWNTDGLIVVTPLLSETRADYIKNLSVTGHPIVFIASGGSGPTVANAAPASSFTSAPPPQSITSTEPSGPSAPTMITNSDDRENATPAGWWVYSGQTVTDVVNTINNNNARIVNIYLESLAQPRRFTVTYVHNTGAYAKRLVVVR